jgi:uncharacterized membrane protein
MPDHLDQRPPIAAGVLLGAGLGGLVDDILFQQLLQIHKMLSAKRPVVDLVSAQVNMSWDGLFRVGTWTLTSLGLAMLWRAGGRRDVPWSTPTFVGSLSIGWAAFNLIEGIIDHHILSVHPVVERPGHLPFDLAFLALGAVLIGTGAWAVRGDRSARAGLSPGSPTS